MRPEPYEAVTEALGREMESLNARIEALERAVGVLVDIATETAYEAHNNNGHWECWEDCGRSPCRDLRDIAKETP